MLIYLSSPYSHAEPRVMQARFEYAEKRLSEFLRQGYPVFSPIVHGHVVAKKYDLPKTFEFWRAIDLAYLANADEMWVLQMPGWEDSVGVTEEIAFCKKHYIVTKYLEFLNEDKHV